MFPPLLKQDNQIIERYVIISALEDAMSHSNNLLALKRHWKLPLQVIYDDRNHIAFMLHDLQDMADAT